MAAILAVAGCDDGPTASIPSCSDAETLRQGDTVQATLGIGDPRFQGAYIEYRGLRLTGAATVILEQSSTELDPLLFLFDSAGEVRSQAYDPEGVPEGQLETATITVTLEAGCHLLGASSWSDDGGGDYTLTVSNTG